MTPSPVWHPFTQHGLEAPPVPIRRAHGAWLETVGGDRLFDAISSWWVVTHGHNHPRIVDAIQRQSSDLNQVIFAGFTHANAERLARQLVAVAPAGLNHVFFSDSGSTAVEVALKMALGFWANRGHERTRIIALEHAYHGDTVGTMSAGARGVFNAAYAPLLFDVIRIPAPAGRGGDETLAALEMACKRGDAAAVIVEPLVLGAGGMRMYDPVILTAMTDIARRHGILLIADEVMTGFGRTGTMFAVEQAGVAPDIMCVAKGLTGGALPLAATLASSDIFAAHKSKDRAQTFFHSSSYTANAIACAAAAANLDIWAEEPVLERIDALATAQTNEASRLAADARFRNVRTHGTISAFELDGGPAAYTSDLSLRLRQAALDRRVVLRPLGSTIYVMPPYCTTENELSGVYDTIRDIAGEVLA